MPPDPFHEPPPRPTERTDQPQTDQPPGGYPQRGPFVQPRNPILYALASLIIIGLGTMLGGRPIRGLFLLGITVVTFIFTFIPFIGLLFIPALVGLWVLSGFDGYRTAQKWNARHGILS